MLSLGVLIDTLHSGMKQAHNKQTEFKYVRDASTDVNIDSGHIF